MAHCVARDVEVHKLGIYFTTTFEFERTCCEKTAPNSKPPSDTRRRTRNTCLVGKTWS